VTEAVMQHIGVRRVIMSAHPVVLRFMTVFLEYFLPRSPVSVYWLDYLATNRTCALDTVPRVFNLMPARFTQRLAYLDGQNWGRELRRSIFRRDGQKSRS
jgi:hypothetical protein